MSAGEAFVLFGNAHVGALVIIVCLCLWITRVPPVDSTNRITVLLAGLLTFLVILKPMIFIGVYEQSWSVSLPLDLCRVNEALCAYLLFRRSYRSFEVAYFLALAGSVTALITPDLQHGFPDPRFLLFFTSHGLAVLAVLYAVFGWGFRPTLRSLGVTLAFLVGYTLVIAGLNLLLDANYLFLRRPPEGASVLDLFGPWPYYLIGMIGLAVVGCVLCYLPIALIHRLSDGQHSGR